MLCAGCGERKRPSAVTVEADADGVPGVASLCGSCRAGLFVPPAVIRGGLLVRAAFWHQGVARVLMHRLKYDGIHAIAQLFAAALHPAIVELTEQLCTSLCPPMGGGRGLPALVPVPRTAARSARHGIDTARVLARKIAVAGGVPVHDVLRAPLWNARHAGADRSHRNPPVLYCRRGRLRTRLPVVIVDDVVTTGATIQAAAGVLADRGFVVAATLAGTLAP